MMRRTSLSPHAFLCSLLGLPVWAGGEWCVLLRRLANGTPVLTPLAEAPWIEEHPWHPRMN